VNAGTLALNVNKTAGWERSDFPIVCETCLGENPYVRMMRADFDKECKICARPFTIFKWKPGRNARYKKTEICQTCAKMKNVCQTCLLDLEFGLPVQVRDASLPEGNVPLSDVGKEYQAELMEKQVAQGFSAYNKAEMRNHLNKIARSQPYYKRNEAHVCSFFLKGNCTRGELCPYRHELPDEKHDPELANQNIKDRFHGVNDPVAKKMLTRLNVHKLTPPLDPEIKTLYVGGVNEGISEEDLRGSFYAYGEIREIKLVPKSSCAFITYATRESAEKAAEALFNNLVINQTTLRVSWSKPQTHDGGMAVPPVPVPTNNFFGLVPNFQPFIPPPPNPALNKPLYPSMNPNRMGSKRDR
jgi:pre-mRNA-splicing factor RBM22/SLT11